MNRSLANWLVQNPAGAVFVTGLLGLLPLFGLGFAFFLPGAVPALLLLVRGERIGLAVAAAAGVLLAVSVMLAGRPMTVGLVYAAWADNSNLVVAPPFPPISANPDGNANMDVYTTVYMQRP